MRVGQWLACFSLLGTVKSRHLSLSSLPPLSPTSISLQWPTSAFSALSLCIKRHGSFGGKCSTSFETSSCSCVQSCIALLGQSMLCSYSSVTFTTEMHSDVKSVIQMNNASFKYHHIHGCWHVPDALHYYKSLNTFAYYQMCQFVRWMITKQQLIHTNNISNIQALVKRTNNMFLVQIL